jgi:hypothetical protein
MILFIDYANSFILDWRSLYCCWIDSSKINGTFYFLYLLATDLLGDFIIDVGDLLSGIGDLLGDLLLGYVFLFLF